MQHKSLFVDTRCTARNRTRQHPHRLEALPLEGTCSVVKYVVDIVSRFCSLTRIVTHVDGSEGSNWWMRVTDVNQYQSCSFFP